jgi:hypothetical protein
MSENHNISALFSTFTLLRTQSAFNLHVSYTALYGNQEDVNYFTALHRNEVMDNHSMFVKKQFPSS